MHGVGTPFVVELLEHAQNKHRDAPGISSEHHTHIHKRPSSGAPRTLVLSSCRAFAGHPAPRPAPRLPVTTFVNRQRVGACAPPRSHSSATNRTREGEDTPRRRSRV